MQDVHIATSNILIYHTVLRLNFLLLCCEFNSTIRSLDQFSVGILIFVKCAKKSIKMASIPCGIRNRVGFGLNAQKLLFFAQSVVLSTGIDEIQHIDISCPGKLEIYCLL